MTKQEAASVMAAFATAFRSTIDESHMALWYESVLSRCDAQDAARAVERIVATDERFPTPARFSAVLKAVERREPSRALPVGAVNRERAQEHIAAIRSQLRGESA